jgi:GT2 family glycosyltransferase
VKTSPVVSVVVPSYGRPDSLLRCLSALAVQDYVTFEVLCVSRPDDEATRSCVRAFAANDERFRETIVEQPGLAAAMNAGLVASRAEFVGFTDDDAEAPSHWLATIIAHFGAHAKCGAVGGRDVLQLDEPRLGNPPATRRVGSYRWHGKFYGNHHCPITEDFVRADILKGVNMTYRRKLVRDVVIGEGLRGSKGVQMGTEQSLAAAVGRQGYELHFLREAWLLHCVAPRTCSDNRTDMTSEHALDTTHNYAYTLWRYQPLKTAVAAQMRDWIVGSRKVPGLARLALHPSKTATSFAHWREMWSGLLAGLRARRFDCGVKC